MQNLLSCEDYVSDAEGVFMRTNLLSPTVYGFQLLEVKLSKVLINSLSDVLFYKMKSFPKQCLGSF